MKRFFLLATMFAMMTVEPAFAYTGPGLGAATVAIVVGFFTSIFVALFAVIWYPIKRLLKNRKKTQSAQAAAAPTEEGASLKKSDLADSVAPNASDSSAE